MPLAFLAIPAAFVLFGMGVELARMSMPRKSKTATGRGTNVNPSLPSRRTFIQWCGALPGVRVGHFYFDSVCAHAKKFCSLSYLKRTETLAQQVSA
jgi:hypothetical protein